MLKLFVKKTSPAGRVNPDLFTLDSADDSAGGKSYEGDSNEFFIRSSISILLLWA